MKHSSSRRTTIIAIASFSIGLLLPPFPSFLISKQSHSKPQAPFTKWADGISSEERFWDYIMKTRGTRWKKDGVWDVAGVPWPGNFSARMDADTPMSETILNNIKECVPEDVSHPPYVRILDVGAGPFSSLATKNSAFNVELIAVDPLAPLYDRLLSKHDIFPPTRTHYCPVEDLTKHFSADYFHFVHMQNALDHSFDPMKGILNMVSLTAPGCSLYLAHNRNEANNQKGTGFHQWNMDIVNGKFIISQPGVRIDVFDELRKVGEFSTEVGLLDMGKFFVMIKKNRASH